MSNEEKILAILGTMQENIGSMQENIGSMQQDIRSMKQDIQTLNARVDGLEKRMDGLDQKIDRTKQEMITLFDAEFTQNFNLLSESMDILMENLVGDDFKEDTTNRLDVLEAVTRAHSHEIAALKRAN